jgi:hypothetical protein
MTRKGVSYIFLLLAFTTSTVWTGISQESAQAPLMEEVIIPEGTILPIVLTDYLNTRSSQVGDTFYADTTYPIWIQQRLIIPKGSNIRGTVTEVVRPGRIKGKGRLAVRFDDVLLPNGVKRDLSASFRGIHGPGDESFDRKSETGRGCRNCGCHYKPGNHSRRCYRWRQGCCHWSRDWRRSRPCNDSLYTREGFGNCPRHAI